MSVRVRVRVRVTFGQVNHLDPWVGPTCLALFIEQEHLVFLLIQWVIRNCNNRMSE